MSYRDRLTLMLKLLVATFLAVTIGIGILVFEAARRAEIDATPVIEKQGIAVAQSIRATFEHASMLGIPIRDVRGVSEYFGRLLDEYGDLRFIAVVNPLGKILYYEGMGRARLGRLIGQDDIQTVVKSMSGSELAAEGTTVVIGDFSVSVLPIGDPQHAEALLYVSVQRSEVTRALMVRSFEVVTVLFLALLAAVQVLRAAIDGWVWLPLRRLGQHFDNGSAGDFAMLARPRSRDEVAQLALSHNRAVISLGEQRDLFLLTADEVATGSLDGDARTVAQDLTDQINNRLRLNIPRGGLAVATISELALRLPAFLTSAALGIAIGLQAAIAFTDNDWPNVTLGLAFQAAGAVLGIVIGLNLRPDLLRWTALGALVILIGDYAIEAIDPVHQIATASHIVIGIAWGAMLGGLWSLVRRLHDPRASLDIGGMARRVSGPALSGIVGGFAWGFAVQINRVDFDPAYIALVFVVLALILLYGELPASRQGSER